MATMFKRNHNTLFLEYERDLLSKKMYKGVLEFTMEPLWREMLMCVERQDWVLCTWLTIKRGNNKHL